MVQLCSILTALNDAAVSLLAKGHVAVALQVLTEATTTIVSSTETSTSSTASHLCWILHPQLERAVAWCHLMLSTDDNEEETNEMQVVMDVHVLEAHDPEAWSDAVLYGPSSSMVFALQCSGSGSSSAATTSMHCGDNQTRYCCSGNSNGVHNVTMVLAMLWYNTAMAYRCWYAETKSAQVVHLQAAQRALWNCLHNLMQQQTMPINDYCQVAPPSASWQQRHLWPLAQCALERVQQEQERHEQQEEEEDHHYSSDETTNNTSTSPSRQAV